MKLASFDSAQSAAEALAAQVAWVLRAGLATRGAASLAVPGGRTPTPLFRALRVMDLDWERIVVTLTDDRCVPETDAASNAALVRGELLRDRAAVAQWVPLHDGAADAGPVNGARGALGRLPLPFDAVVLGMGEDGHFASLFPEDPGLAAALDVRAAPACVAMRAPVAPVQRVSLNLAALIDTRRLFLLVTGMAKRQVLEQAWQIEHQGRWPIGALLAMESPAVEVFWSS